jgi:hypothetical protein
MMVEYIYSIVLPSMVAEERSATVEQVRENETSYHTEVKAMLEQFLHAYPRKQQLSSDYSPNQP